MHSRYALPLACLGALTWATAHTPAFSQTSPHSANSTDAAHERSQRQSDNVYRWIKLHAESTRKPESVKPRTKPENGAVVTRKPDTRDAAGTAQPTQVTSEEAPTPSDVVAANPAPDIAATPTPPAALASEASAAVAEVEPDLKPISQPQPDIPRDLRAGIANGRVMLSFTVQPDGSVTEPSVVRASNRRLGKPALEAVSQWRFEPIRIARAAQVEIEFNLD